MDICDGIWLISHMHLSVVLDTGEFRVCSPDAEMSQVPHKAGVMSAGPTRITQAQTFSWIKPLAHCLQREGSRGQVGGMSCPGLHTPQPFSCVVLLLSTLVTVTHLSDGRVVKQGCAFCSWRKQSCCC